MPLLIIAGCGPSAPIEQLTVAAAASLAPAFDLLGPEFTEDTGVEVILSYAATGHLAQQVRNGGPFDIFASANAAFVDDLIQEGYLQSESRTLFATGHLILLLHPGRTSSIEGLSDLANEEIGKIAIANPGHAPYGRAAQEALQGAGLWKIVQDRLVYGESVRQVGQFVETGNVSVGFVSASIVPSVSLQVIPIPDTDHSSIDHVAAVLSSSGKRQLAAEFLAFLTSKQAMSILHDHGFETLPQE